MVEIKSKNNRVRRRFKCTQRVNATPEAIFPLLCPVREYEWIPEWDCRLVYTESGIAEAGCVFQTDRVADGGLDTWVVNRHEPYRSVGFVRINQLRAMQYDIWLTSNGDGTTTLAWEQLITSLSDQGDRHVAALREADFIEVVGKLETLLNRHLAERPLAGGN